MDALEQQLAALRTMEEEITAAHPEPRAESAPARQLATIRAAAGALSAGVATLSAATAAAAATGAEAQPRTDSSFTIFMRTCTYLLIL